MTLRPYQVAAIKACLKAWKDEGRCILLVLPTGAGKTVVFCSIARRSCSRP